MTFESTIFGKASVCVLVKPAHNPHFEQNFPSKCKTVNACRMLMLITENVEAYHLLVLCGANTREHAFLKSKQ